LIINWSNIAFVETFITIQFLFRYFCTESETPLVAGENP